MGTGTDTGIALVSPDYWPLPWYFRDYKKVGYYSANRAHKRAADYRIDGAGRRSQEDLWRSLCASALEG